MEILLEYGIFLLKVATIVVAIVIPILVILLTSKNKSIEKGQLLVKNLSETFEKMGNTVKAAQLNSKNRKKFLKGVSKDKKKISKESKQPQTVYILDFKGDIQASQVNKLKHEINAILLSKSKCKEVVIKVESGGGGAYAYGLCAAELKRLVDNKIKLTVCVDKVAASGGYLMSCVANKIIAAPWAIVGSIGVIAQLPNFNRLLEKNDVDFELHTAGEFKRTLTMLGKNTEEGRSKFKSELEDLHKIFKEFVKQNRPHIDINSVATGEVWQGNKAIEMGLVDELGTSDDYLVKLSSRFQLFEINYQQKKNIGEKLGMAAETLLDKTFYKFHELINKDKYTS
tara:strand:+ start:7166 stop:8188 length:1023 start_codon:yes stop_codon:yes gene_type:complete